MKRQYAASFAYLIVVIMTLVLRVTGAVGIYDLVHIDSGYYFTLIVQLLIFFALPTALYLLTSENTANCRINALCCDFGIKKVGLCDMALSIGIGICMIYIATVVSFLWNAVLSSIGFTSSSTKTEYTSVGVLFLELIMTAVLPAIFEEYTHRGLLFAGYRQFGWKVVLLSALLFALMHQNIKQTGYTFFDGIVLALLAYYTGSILPSICVHFLNNAVSVLWDYGEYTGGWLSFMDKANAWLYGSLTGYIIGMVLFVLCAIIMIVLFYKLRERAVECGRVPATQFKDDDNAV
ncbi:MAG: CPBP family intramembrane metalloprotease [Clostridia bacterium]|nr:CPBP family intramembrane metalloprotease [Clostridia bacterium]